MSDKLFHLGSKIDVIVHRKRVGELAKMVLEQTPRDTSKYVMSPMPGMLKSVSVQAVGSVGPDSELAVVEAMKTENDLKSSRLERIAKVNADVGNTLSVGQTSRSLNEPGSTTVARR